MCAEAVPRARALGRAVSAEAESPQNPQLYGLRSRAAAGAAAPAPRPQPVDRLSPLPRFPVAAGMLLPDPTPAASGVMDLSESQGPIKKRLKVR